MRSNSWPMCGCILVPSATRNLAAKHWRIRQARLESVTNTIRNLVDDEKRNRIQKTLRGVMKCSAATPITWKRKIFGKELRDLSILPRKLGRPRSCARKRFGGVVTVR